jgi:hypothetical protein
MARTANNAPFTNQGRADLRRTPTEGQIAFNQNGSSQIACVDAALFVTNEEGELGPAVFDVFTRRESDPTAFAPTRLSVFLWMTDRVLLSLAVQQYPGTVYPLGETVFPVGANLSNFASVFKPNNGMAALPAGVTCTPLQPLTDFGAQSVLSYGAGATSLAVRGTPMLLELGNNEYWDSEEPQNQATCRVNVVALSESLLSGKHQVRYNPPLPNGEVDIWLDGGTGRYQILLPLAQYLFGQYWLQGNIIGTPGLDADIVGVYTQPLLP